MFLKAHRNRSCQEGPFRVPRNSQHTTVNGICPCPLPSVLLGSLWRNGLGGGSTRSRCYCGTSWVSNMSWYELTLTFCSWMTGTCFASRWKIYWHSEGSRHQHIVVTCAMEARIRTIAGDCKADIRQIGQGAFCEAAGTLFFEGFIWIYCQRGSRTTQDWRLCNFMIHPRHLAFSKDSWILQPCIITGLLQLPNLVCQVRLATSQAVGRQEGFQVHRRPVPLQKGCRDAGICLFPPLGCHHLKMGLGWRRSFGDTSDTTYYL